MVNCSESSSEPIQELEMELEPDKEVEGFLDALKVGWCGIDGVMPYL